MKATISCFAFLLLAFSEANGQHLRNADTNKYRINLPDYWKPGNKVWRILTDKLPLICEELQGKDICGDDCNPIFTIEFEMSDPIIIDYIPSHVSSTYANNQSAKPTEYWDIQTSYEFECSLLLRNEKGIYVKRFILVDTNEAWKVSSRVTLNAYAPPQPMQLYNRRAAPNRSGMVDPLSNFSNVQFVPATGQEGETPYAYINRNKEKLVPSFRDMLTVVDIKINSW